MTNQKLAPLPWRVEKPIDYGFPWPWPSALAIVAANGVVVAYCTRRDESSDNASAIVEAINRNAVEPVVTLSPDGTQLGRWKQGFPETEDCPICDGIDPNCGQPCSPVNQRQCPEKHRFLALGDGRWKCQDCPLIVDSV